VNIFEYKIPFKKPFKSAGNIYLQRKGIVLSIDSSAGPVYAEAAPLPGFSTDTLSEVKNWLFINRGQTEKAIKKVGSHFWNQVPTPSSLAYALDAIHWLYLSAESGLSLSGLLFSSKEDDRHSQVLVNKTLPIQDIGVNSILEDIRYSKRNGFRTFKCKVGRDVDQELDMINSIREAHSDIAIRLDANRAFSYSDAVIFMQNLESANIEYVEEPLNREDLSLISDLYNQTSVPIAADESTHVLSDALDLCKANWVDTLVLKPSLIGSFSNLFKIVEKASLNGKKMVLSSTFETAIGRLIAAHLSFSVSKLGETAHGLATGEWLQHDFINETKYLKKGSIILNNNPGLGYPVNEHSVSNISTINS